MGGLFTIEEPLNYLSVGRVQRSGVDSGSVRECFTMLMIIRQFSKFDFTNLPDTLHASSNLRLECNPLVFF